MMLRTMTCVPSYVDHEDDDLCALIDHEADAVSEAIAGTSHIPARVDHVDFSLDLTTNVIMNNYDVGLLFPAVRLYD